MSKVDLSGFVSLLSKGKVIRSDMDDAMKPFLAELEKVRVEQDKLATKIGEAYGSGTFTMPNGVNYKVRQYRKDDKQGRVGFYFLPEQEKTGVVDLSGQ